MKLHMGIELKRVKSHAQDPLLWHQYFGSYYPLSIVTLFCPNAITRSSTDAIEMKLHMWIELKWVMSHAYDP